MSQLTILLKFLSIKLSLGKLFCSHNLKHISNMYHNIRKIVYLNHFSAHTIGAYRTRKQTKGFVIYESLLRFDGLWCKIDNLNLLYLFVKEMMKLQMQQVLQSNQGDSDSNGCYHSYLSCCSHSISTKCLK